MPLHEKLLFKKDSSSPGSQVELLPLARLAAANKHPDEPPSPRLLHGARLQTKSALNRDLLVLRSVLEPLVR